MSREQELWDAGRKTPWTKREVRGMIYGAISAWLHRGCCVDTNNPQFHDLAEPIQKEIAKALERKANALASANRPVPGQIEK